MNGKVFSLTPQPVELQQEPVQLCLELWNLRI